jgi:hypothetical protein
MDLTRLFIEEIRHTQLPRDFRFYDGNPDDGGKPLQALELLKLDLVIDILCEVEAKDPSLAIAMALARLLVPCLVYRGSGRHIVVEPWTRHDLEGKTLYADTRTKLAADLAREQATEELKVRGAARPPDSLLSAAFWLAQTELPDPPSAFVDAQLAAFAKALYKHLVPPGQGALQVTNVKGCVEHLKNQGFRPLGLGLLPREASRLLKKLLAVSVKLSSQLCGEVARRLVVQQLKAYPDPNSPPELTAEELAVLNFRYGALPELALTNIEFFRGFGEETWKRLNNLFRTYANLAPLAERRDAADQLHRWMHLLCTYRSRRKVARSDEKRNNRDRRPRTGQRGMRPAEVEADRRARDPQREVAWREEWEMKLSGLLPHLKPRDARLVQALVDADGDRAEAARRCGLTREQFSRRFRQTVRPNVRAVQKRRP